MHLIYWPEFLQSELSTRYILFLIIYQRVSLSKPLHSFWRYPGSNSRFFRLILSHNYLGWAVLLNNQVCFFRLCNSCWLISEYRSYRITHHRFFLLLCRYIHLSIWNLAPYQSQILFLCLICLPAFLLRPALYSWGIQLNCLRKWILLSPIFF